MIRAARREPEAARHRLGRHPLPAPRGRDDAARGNGRGDGAPARDRQGPLLRHLELSRLARRAHRRDCAAPPACRPPIVCQPPYNAMTRAIETELLPCCAHYGIGVVAYSPLARGVLTGKYAPGAAPPEGSRAARNDTRILQTEFRPESLALAQRVVEHAALARPHAARSSRSAGSGTTRSCTASSAGRRRSRSGRTTSHALAGAVRRRRRGAGRFAGRAGARVDAGLHRSALSGQGPPAARSLSLSANARRFSACDGLGEAAPPALGGSTAATQRLAGGGRDSVVARPRSRPRLPSEASQRRTTRAHADACSDRRRWRRRQGSRTQRPGRRHRRDAGDRHDLAERHRRRSRRGRCRGRRRTSRGSWRPPTGTPIDEPVRCMPARDATTARQARECQPVQDERVDRQQHDQHELGLQLRVGEVVGALEQAVARRARAPVA